jgi:hypothetical protein
MKYVIRLAAIFTVFVAGIALANAQTQPEGRSQDPSEKSKSDRKADHNHDSHLDGVNRRGDAVMGFSHVKTTHHFLLKTDGGVIQVETNDANDGAGRDQIRRHLKHIAKKFSEGDFAAPALIHGQTPPGVSAMQSLTAEIKYEFEELERGGRIRISTKNSEAVKAIHEFLRFQIKDHQTGDSGKVEN